MKTTLFISLCCFGLLAGCHYRYNPCVEYAFQKGCIYDMNHPCPPCDNYHRCLDQVDTTSCLHQRTKSSTRMNGMTD